ncbi:MAG TPA: hypothetical protein VG929_06180 [Actinomycetota bacterium]|nr:hypothetical protein [Actinomycetota bacterium]
MTDFDRRLSDALKTATSSYRPADPYVAKQAFLHRFRRRRWAGGIAMSLAAGTAAVAAFFVVPGLLTQDASDKRAPVAASPTGASEIPVGGAPNGIAFGGRRVWVANSADGTVSSIATADNRVVRTYDVGGTPDDLDVGLRTLWVTDSERGVVTKVPLGPAGEREEIVVGDDGGRIDISLGSGAAWVVSDGALLRIDAATDAVTTIPGITDATDVAAGHGAVAVVGESFIGRVEPGSPSVTPLASVAATANQDLHLSPGAAWFGDGDAGTLTRVDLASGEMAEPVEIGGTYLAIAQGSGSIWVVSGDAGDEGRLLRIDPSDGAVVGEPVALSGRPYDVATGARAVWVLNRSAETVTRLDPNA